MYFAFIHFVLPSNMPFESSHDFYISCNVMKWMECFFKHCTLRNAANLYKHFWRCFWRFNEIYFNPWRLFTERLGMVRTQEQHWFIKPLIKRLFVMSCCSSIMNHGVNLWIRWDIIFRLNILYIFEYFVRRIKLVSLAKSH